MKASGCGCPQRATGVSGWDKGPPRNSGSLNRWAAAAQFLANTEG